MIRISSRTFLAHLESTGLARVLDIAYHAAIADPAAAATSSRIARPLGLETSNRTRSVRTTAHATMILSVVGYFLMMTTHTAIDGLPTTRRVFVIWLGGPMSATRAASLDAIRRHVGVPVELISEQSLDRWVTAAAPLHPAFSHLSAIHQADYLRCYLMHHHGGGYLDLKPLEADWRPAFDQLDANPDLLTVGYPEVGRRGVGTFGVELLGSPRPLHSAWWRYRWLQLNYRRLIGVCAFVCRPQSTFTTAWFATVTQRLDSFQAALAAHPARHLRDHAGFPIDGQPSGYPVTWTALLADIFHPLALRHRHHILNTLPPPSFHGYQ